ncbi:hypothetical protein B0T24DRAFT_99515 [Lasiosphaeria ovina]|uniref:Very long-chain fatty acid transport protein n=1 Tax=Lasiosphaeria ovina TaxID=92902 RepID=A0AAE0JUE6_9PEZI|nr:hypothetical protein B0T24DRAFT_99515 [Lasiosphaeria ovina]
MAALSAVPLSLAIPAVAAVAAYINARCLVSYDLRLLASLLPTLANVAWWKSRGQVNLFYRLESLATSKSSQDRDFLRWENKSYTYAQAYDIVLRYANWLSAQRGVKKGELVALDFQNTDTFLFLVLALWAIGARPALINYNLGGKPLVHCIKQAKSRLVLVDPVVAENVGEDVRSDLPDVAFEVVTPELELQILQTDPVRLPDEVREDPKSTLDMAMLIFTSGTTGLPKGAIVSWAKILVISGFSGRLIGTKSSDVFYSAMPLYHSTAMLLGFIHTLLAGATYAMSRKFSTSHFWEDIRKHDATITQYVGETCRYLLAAPAAIDPATGENLDRKHSLRIAFGNGLRPDVWNRFKERFGIETIVEFYAATEGNFATWNISRNDFSTGAVGRGGSLYSFLIGKTYAIVGVDHDTELPYRDPKTGFCSRTPTGEPGELLFKLPASDVESRFQGYYGDKDATSKKVMRSVFTEGDAWFRTGDVLRCDQENRLWFSDRIGDTFRWKSENVSTAEVSQCVGLHPDVVEANVYGVQVPNHEGRAGCAAVIFREGAFPVGDTLKTLAEHVTTGLPKYARPLFLRVVSGGALQSTGTNKQQKHHLRNEGVEPGKTGSDEIFWLNGGTYVSFDPTDWKSLQAGQAKL